MSSRMPALSSFSMAYMDMSLVSSLASSHSSPRRRTRPDSRTWAAKVRGAARRSMQSTPASEGRSAEREYVNSARRLRASGAGAVEVDRIRPAGGAFEEGPLEEGTDQVSQLFELLPHTPSILLGPCAVNGGAQRPKRRRSMGCLSPKTSLTASRMRSCGSSVPVRRGEPPISEEPPQRFSVSRFLNTAGSILLRRL